MKLASSEQSAKALAALAAVSHDDSELVRSGFVLAKRKVHLRFLQGSSYYTEYPWNICSLTAFVMEPAGKRRAAAVRVSRALAGQLLDQWQAGELPPNTFGSIFFQEPLLSALRQWSVGSAGAMQQGLFKEVLSYALSLTSMQRLESRHHLINLKMSPARASSAALISANLRRRLNRDCRDVRLRDHLHEYCQQFSQLVEEPWDSLPDLHKLVSGHAPNIMYESTAEADALIAAASGSRQNDAELVSMQQHLKVMLEVGGHYAIPLRIMDDGSTIYDCFQLVSRQPGSKKYVQKIVGYGEDAWYEQSAIVPLGRVEVESEVVLLDAPQPTSLLPLPDGVSIPGAASTEAHALPVREFFKFGFSNIYKFSDVEHSCELSMDAIESAAAGEDPMSDDEGPEEESVGSQLRLADNPAEMLLGTYWQLGK